METADKNEYPYQVGRVCYPTIEDAQAAVVRAHEIYPEASMSIIDRRSGVVLHTYPFGVK